MISIILTKYTVHVYTQCFFVKFVKQLYSKVGKNPAIGTKQPRPW